jgi:chemotaxis signal transduction protein
MIRDIILKKAKGEPVYQSRTPFMRFLRFRVGGVSFVIDLPLVQEICNPGKFYNVPDSSIFLLGLMNIRNNIVPVYDIRMILNIQSVWKSVQSSVIVLSFQEETLGLYVDEVKDIISIYDENEIIESEDFISGFGIDIEGEKCGIIDLEFILSKS